MSKRAVNVLDAYEIQQTLGSGAFGTVYKVRRKTPEGLDPPTALKVVCSLNPTTLHDLRREVSILQRMTSEFPQHQGFPHFVRWFDGVYGADECVCVEMEYVDGKTVRELDNKFGGLGSDLVVAVFKQLSHTLCCMHSIGIAHRDIKGDNAMITENGRVVLVDFGLACYVRDAPEPDLACSEAYRGTKAFWTPSMWKRNAQFQRMTMEMVFPADVWALAVLMSNAGEVGYVFGFMSKAKAVALLKRSAGLDRSLVDDYPDDKKCQFLATPVGRVLVDMFKCADKDRPTSAEVRERVWAIEG